MPDLYNYPLNSDTVEPSCRASANCAGGPGDDLGVMTLRECCLDNSKGLAYISSEGSCISCIGKWHMN